MKLFHFVLAASFLLASCAVENTPAIPLSTSTLSPYGAVIATAEVKQTLQAATAAAASPTVVPTPVGGKNGLLLSFNGATIWEMTNGTGDWRTNLDLVYIYNIESKRHELLLEGYHCIGVSPNGGKIALRKTENGKTDLFVVDLAKPEEVVLLYEDVFNPNVLADYSYWLPGSEWIAFIALKDGIRQVFIIHPDGSELTQVTNSSIGAVEIQPVFHDGVYWGEGKEYKSGLREIKNYKWTKLDGTEVIGSFYTVSPSGKYITRSLKPQNPDCAFCDYVIGDPATGEIREVTLVNPTSDNYASPDIQPLSDDKWLVQWWGAGRWNQWIYSPDGKPLFAFADLPHDHAPLPEGEDNVDFYGVVLGNSSKLPVQLISPDGNLLLIRHDAYTQKEISSNVYSRSNEDINYYLLNLSTFEIQPVPNLVPEENNLLGQGHAFFWVELP